MTVVRTVSGDVEPGRLGRTYAHEHLIIDSDRVRDRNPEISLPSVDEAIAEVNECIAVGAGAFVDAMPIGAGRNPEKLAAVASTTGAHIVMATGLHLPMYYDDPMLVDATAPLVEWFVADIEAGVDRNDHRGPLDRTAVHAGVIKVATQGADLDDRDRRVLEAAAQAHRVTGAPLLTHCEGGRGGLEQVAALGELGVAPSRIVLSHTDKVLDAALHHELLATGANVEYDQALRQDPADSRGTAWLVAEMVGRGYGAQMMFGTDGARRSMWATLGGAPGLAWLLTGFIEQLRALGLTEAHIEALLVENPARWLAFGTQ